MKLEVTELAIEKIKEIKKDSDGKKLIRINLSGVGEGGASYGLVMDQQKEGDEVIEVQGITFLLSSELLNFEREGFEVDYLTKFPLEGFNVCPLSFIHRND